MGLTLPSLDKAIPNRAVSPMVNRATVVMANQLIPQAMVRAAMAPPMDKLRAQAMVLSQLPKDMVQPVAMAAARVPNLLMVSNHPILAIASSQPLAALQGAMVAAPRAVAMGSRPRVGAMVSSLAMVDSKAPMDSNKATIPLRDMASRTSITAAVGVVEVVEVAMAKISHL